MCWSPEVSLGTYLFSIVPLIVLTFYYNWFSMSLFFAMHSWISMQLIEFFLWIYLKNPDMNYFFSIVGFVAIMSQPAFFIASIPQFPQKYAMLAFYLFCVGYYYVAHMNTIEFKTVVAKNGHLEWKWLDAPLYNALMWLAFFAFRPAYLFLKDPKKNKSEIWFFLALTGGFAISYATFVEANTWASMWCYIANIVSLRYYWILFHL